MKRFLAAVLAWGIMAFAGCSSEDGGAVCGDGAVEGSEQCDDGNSASGDGCDSGCFAEQGWDCAGGVCEAICGDGIDVVAEVCDPGATPGYCSDDCSEVIGSCGDGVVQSEAEDCDGGRGCSQCAEAFAFTCTPSANECEATGLPGDKLLGDLSSQEVFEYCEWLTDTIGGPGAVFDCGSTRFTVNSPSTCAAQNDFAGVAQCSVQEWEDFISGLGSRCNVMQASSAPSCAN